MKLYSNLNVFNFVSVLLVSPSIKLGNVEYNKNIILKELEKNANNTNLLVFPELCLTGASYGDYFFNNNLTKELDEAIYDILIESYKFHSTLILGTCVSINHKFINCALFISDGKLLGIVPNVTNNRWFSLPDVDSIMINGYDVKVSNRLIFQSFCNLGICFGKENIAFLNDAEIIVCLDSIPYKFDNKTGETIRTISKISNQSILYVGANVNESTTDYVYDDTLFVCECGNELVNNYYLSNIDNNKLHNLNFNTKYYRTEIDIDVIRGERKHNYAFNQQPVNQNLKNEIIKFDFIIKDFNFINRLSQENKSTYIDPFNTFDISNNISKALEILTIQALALAKRIKSIDCQTLIIGVSAGIDSTLSLLVAVKSFEILGLDKKKIFAISLPGLATSTSTNEVAEKLCNSLGVNYSLISINDSVCQHFKDIGHAESNLNIVYENAQARMRTLILFDIANAKNGIVVGTGDMSEIALGWNTFNGDHISSYNVNSGIPKTVAIAILSAIVNSDLYSQLAIEQIKFILEKPISPELIPADNTGKVQSTEDIIGQYELHDFFLYYYLKYFFSREKILYIAGVAFEDKYSFDTIEKTFDIFMTRFKRNQYKRNCSVDGPSIFAISLSPRGGLILPSDAE